MTKKDKLSGSLKKLRDRLSRNPLTGVWVVYSYDMRAEVDVIFRREITARRLAEDYQKVAFLPYGRELRDIID